MNGKAYSKNWLNYPELIKGPTFDYKMAATPNMKRGIKKMRRIRFQGKENKGHALISISSDT